MAVCNCTEALFCSVLVFVLFPAYGLSNSINLKWIEISAYYLLWSRRLVNAVFFTVECIDSAWILGQNRVKNGEEKKQVDRILLYLRVWCDDVDKTNDGQQYDADEPEDELFPQRQRLHKAHLLAVPDARQMLLTVGMSDELQRTSSSNTVHARMRPPQLICCWVTKHDSVINSSRRADKPDTINCRQLMSAAPSCVY